MQASFVGNHILARQFGSATNMAENWQIVTYFTSHDAGSPSDCEWLIPGTYTGD